MALKGKSKSKRSGARKVARPPKEAMQKRSRDKRRIELNPITVLGGLFVLTMVGVIVWALIVTLSPSPVEGIDEYNDATVDVRRDLDAATSELMTLADEVIAGSTEPNAAAEAAEARIPTLETDAETIRTAPASSDFADARIAQENGARLLVQSATTMALMRDRAPELGAALAKKSGRIARDGGAVLEFGTNALAAAENRETFDESGGEVGGLPAGGNDPYEPAPPLDGLGAAGAVEPPSVNTDTQSDEAYAEAVSGILTDLDTAISDMGEAVSAYEENGDAAALQAAAATWAEALGTAIDAVAATARPETLHAADVLIRNSLWIWLESVRSFASIGAQPELAEGLLESGQALRLIGDQLRASANAAITDATDVDIPAAPASGFPPDVIGGMGASDGSTPTTAPAQGGNPAPAPAPGS